MPKGVRTKDMTEQQLIATVNGLEIKLNSLYKIENKPDPSAPSGLVELGTTMIPSKGNGINISCRYLEEIDGTGMYDTGFYPESPCYRGLDEATKGAIIKNLTTYIKKPYEDLLGKPNLLAANNESFWSNYIPFIYADRVLDTKNPHDLLCLYMGIRGYDLTPVGQEGNPIFSESAYIVRDASASMSVVERRLHNKMAAISSFAELLKLDAEGAHALLKTFGIIRVNEKPTTESANASFMMWIEKDYQNAELFINLVQKMNSEDGKEEVLLTVAVKKLMQIGKMKKVSGEYFYKDEALGVDLRAVVINLMNKPEFTELREQILKT